MSTKRYVQKHDRALETWQTIYLHVELNRSVSEIAEQLHLDQRTVKERLRFGREQGWWSIDMDAREFPRRTVLASLYALEDDQSLLSRLRRGTQTRTLCQVLVFDDRTQRKMELQSSPNAWAERIDMFGLAVGVYLSGLFDRAALTAVGIGWGETISAVVDGVGAARVGQSPLATPIDCVATVGELVGERPAHTDVSSSGVAERLSRYLNGTSDRALMLRGVPAIIPFSVPLDEVDICVKMIHGYPNYLRVFGPHGIASTLSCVVTSAGNPNQRNKYWREELLRAGVPQRLMATLDISDIGGALIQGGRMNHEQQQLFDELRERFVGVTAEHYRRIAAAATPGVVLCCLDHNKADVVMKCLVNNLVNILIIDADLAGALGRSIR